ncbi:MAG TPA: sigma-54 dependent transcriptional regulator [Polyangia bacterium]|nr:sigma-54 dependent transcriptional regulator [Polyangia bacterium]
MTAHVLVVDDEPLIRKSIRGVLVREGYDVVEAASGTEAWARFQEDRPDIIILDLVLGDADGVELLGRFRAEAPDTKVVLMSAHGSFENAVAAMKLGAHDFIKKPFELAEIVKAARHAERTNTLETRIAYLAAQDRKRANTVSLLHQAPVMVRLLKQVDLAAVSPVPTILVTGESGTGKQLVSRLLHDHSAVMAGPFVELNCSAIPENLVESELFGHERGAFSDAREKKLGLVEVADGGTIFLDEIGDLGAAAQAKLLTFLESRTFRRIGATSVRRVNVRVVAATNRDLAQMVAAKTFREDLYYRLNTITLHIPPLRERREDVRPLALHFMTQSSREIGRRFREIAPDATGILERYRWPGNVRELRSVITRAVLLNDDDMLSAIHLPPEVVTAALTAAESSSSSIPRRSGSPIPSLEEIELLHIRRVLEICGGNQTQAAQHLGITRQTLAKKIGASDESA